MICYLDNAATTRVLPEAALAAQQAMTELYFNPSAIHGGGALARKLLDGCRQTVAEALSVAPGAVFFTSGGTESINTALRQAAQKRKHVGRHIVSTEIEHEATLNTLKALKAEGWEVTLIRPERDGAVRLEAIADALRPDTAVLSLMAVNNETGALLPYARAAEVFKRVSPQGLCHVDAVQAFCKLPLDLDQVDLLSASAHKIGGAKGCGALYVRPGLQLQPLLHGGGQEGGLRSGTEGLPGIAAFAAAVKRRMPMREASAARMGALSGRLLEGLEARGIPFQAVLPAEKAPHILNLSLCKGRSEVYIRVLSDRGVYVSGGSACARGKRSHVLAAMGLDKRYIDAALRVSLCPETREEEIDALLDGLDGASKLF